VVFIIIGKDQLLFHAKDYLRIVQIIAHLKKEQQAHFHVVFIIIEKDQLLFHAKDYLRIAQKIAHLKKD